MSLLSSIKKGLSSQKNSKNNEIGKPDKNTKKARKDFKENLKQSTKIDFSKAENLSKIEIIEYILKSANINQKLISNPVTREKLVDGLKKIIDELVQKGKFDYITKDMSRDERETQILKKSPNYILKQIIKRWNIDSESVSLEPEIISLKKYDRKLNTFHKTTEVLRTRGDNVLIETTKYHSKDDEIKKVTHWMQDDTIRTYNQDGIEIQQEYQEKGLWYGRENKESYRIKRTDLDKAELMMDNKVIILDLLYKGSKTDIATLEIEYEYGDMGEFVQLGNIYQEIDENDEEAIEKRKQDINKKIEKSKYKEGCKKYIESINKDYYEK